MTAEEIRAALTLTVMCGAPLTIETPTDTWILVCTQDPGHDGPHVGVVSWSAETTYSGVK